MRLDKQQTLFGTVVFLIVTQLFSAAIVLYELFDVHTSWHVKPVSAEVVITRFVCGIVLHVYLQPELVQAHANMKYALNHPWKFDWPILAFFVGFMQALVAIAIETVNYVLLLTHSTHLDIVVGFLALVFISHFSNFFF